MALPCCPLGERGHISVEVQQQKQDGTVVSKHCIWSGSGQTALSMSDIEARPMADRPGPRAGASFSLGLPASARPAAMAPRRPVSRQIDTDWVPPLETNTVLTENPEYMPRSLGGLPRGMSDELTAGFRQLPLRNSLPSGEPTCDASLRNGRQCLRLAAAVLVAPLWSHTASMTVVSVYYGRGEEFHVVWQVLSQLWMTLSSG